MSNTKILAVDLDGTLFADDKSICKENIEAINKMLDQGHVLAIDTGRPGYLLEKILKPYPVLSRENIYYLSFQGSVGYDPVNKKSLFGVYLDNDKAIKLLQNIHDAGLTALAFEEGAIYVFEENDDTAEYKRLSKEGLTLINSASDLKGHNLVKLMAVSFNDHAYLHQFEEASRAEFEPHFDFMYSNVSFLEFISKEAGKGSGLIKLANYLDIPMEDTVACGDERNDISMIEAAHIGACVGNGRDELKACADYISEVDNNNGAVADVINKFIING